MIQKKGLVYSKSLYRTSGKDRFYCDILSKRTKFRYAFSKTNKKYEIIQDTRFDLSSIRNNPSKEITRVIRSFSTFPQLADLTLIFRHFLPIMKENTINLLSNSLKKTQRLRSLNLDFTSCSDLPTDKNLCFLSKVISKRTTLQKISINLNCCYHITQIAFIKLFKSLDSLSKLKSLSLILISTSITDEALLHLANSLSNKADLQSLILDFSMCKQITSTGLLYLFKDFAPLAGLTRYKLGLSRCDTEIYASFPTLFKNLKALEKITELSLDFTGDYAMVDQTFSHLDITFFKMKNIQHLNLEFFGCKISNIGLQNFGASMSRLQNLQTFHLSLGLGEADDSGLQKLCPTFAKIKQLKEFKLTFDWSKQIKGQGLSWLASALERMEILEKFELFLGRLPLLEIDQFKNLARDLARNKSISDLRISFVDCQAIPDEAFIEFGGYLGKMENLNFLKIITNGRISYRALAKLQASIENDRISQNNFVLESNR